MPLNTRSLGYLCNGRPQPTTTFYPHQSKPPKLPPSPTQPSRIPLNPTWNPPNQTYGTVLSVMPRPSRAKSSITLVFSQAQHSRSKSCSYSVSQLMPSRNPRPTHVRIGLWTTQLNYCSLSPSYSRISFESLVTGTPLSALSTGSTQCSRDKEQSHSSITTGWQRWMRQDTLTLCPWWVVILATSIRWSRMPSWPSTLCLQD